MGEEGLVFLRSRRLAAFGLWGLMVAAWACGVITVVTGSGTVDGAGLFLPLIGFVSGTVGLLLAVRVTGNRMGWVFLAGGALIAVYASAHQYFYWGVVNDWPLVWVAGWLNYAIYMPAILALIALPLLLFPTGRVPSPRWRLVMWAVVLFGTMSVVFSTIQPTFDDELGSRLPTDISSSYSVDVVDGSLSVIVDNPIGIDGLGDQGVPLILVVLPLVLLGVSFVGPAAAMVYRFRRSEGTERQQIKWLAFSASVAAISLGSFYVIQQFFPGSPILEVLVTIGLLGVLGIPIAAGIAITRYRLYDIDRIVSRTVSYSIVVVVVGVGFFGLVSLVTSILPSQNSLAVAASTLAVAAVFNPLRVRTQRLVDRRFNRSGYQAQVVSEEFTAKLREPLSSQEIMGLWSQTVEEAIQPQAAGIWLKETHPTGNRGTG